MCEYFPIIKFLHFCHIFSWFSLDLSIPFYDEALSHEVLMQHKVPNDSTLYVKANHVLGKTKAVFYY